MGTLSQAELSTFVDLFTGHKDFYGQHIYQKNVDEGSKEKGVSFTKDEPLHITHYESHLKGNNGLGIIPIDKNSNVRFMVFDIDIIGIDVKPFIQINEEYELPFNFFRSKSGGMHVYVFFDEDVKAKKGIELMRKYLYVFGFAQDTEIFPKQTRLLHKQKGNWINLPYYNAKNTVQFLYSYTGEPVPFTKAMFLLEKRKVNFTQFKDAYDNLPLNDAPICLQSIYLHKRLGKERNMFLFDMVTYYKAKGEDYEDKIIQLAQLLPDGTDGPVTEEELHETVFTSQAKTTYSYRCKEAPMCTFCNRDLCILREYGYGGSAVSTLSFENLIQVRGESIYYQWTINGVEMTFYNEAELRDQNRFIDFCMRELHIVPNMLKKHKWYKILEDAFKEITITHIDIEEETSPEALLVSYLEEFLLTRGYARNKIDVNKNKVYKDTEYKEFWFKSKALMKFLIDNKNFRYFKINVIGEKLKKLGGYAKKVYLADKKQARVWAVPYDRFEDKMTDEQDVIDFTHLVEKDTEEKF